MDTNGNTKELIKDLCSRLPYGVKVNVIYSNENASSFRQRVCVEGDNELDTNIIGLHQHNEIDIKPYLFPLSSITEEQKSYINGRWGVNENFEFEIDPLWGEYFVDLSDAVDFINWCYENHFDINGLLPRGLAEDATELNIY